MGETKSQKINNAVSALRAIGKDTDEISAILGMTKAKIRSAERHAMDQSAPKASASADRGMLLPGAVISELTKHAARRGIAPNTLARRIVETSLRENLVDAILDDAEEIDDAIA